MCNTMSLHKSPLIEFRGLTSYTLWRKFVIYCDVVTTPNLLYSLFISAPNTTMHNGVTFIDKIFEYTDITMLFSLSS